MNARQKLLAAAVATAMWAVIQPGPLSAQTSGVGGDGETRLLWRHPTNGSIFIQALDTTLHHIRFSSVFNPPLGMHVVAITTAANSNTYILWTRTDGTISLWLLNPVLNFVTSKVYGPFPFLAAEGLSADTANATNGFRIIWRYISPGQLGAELTWRMDQNLNQVVAFPQGPFPPWTPP
jgi:hypothetical protein